MKHKHIQAHMQVAKIYAKLSTCKKRQVGCIIIKNDNIIAIGYNGTPAGEDNCCEDDNGITLPNVIHAEDNALRKLTCSHESARGAILFVTTAPCIRCAERIAAAKISKVFYVDKYLNDEGLDFLNRKKIPTVQFQD